MGANVGYSAAYFAHHYPDAKIISLEPDKGNFDCLVRNTAHYPNVVAINKGVWWRNANLHVTNPDDDAWGYQFTEKPEAEKAAYWRKPPAGSVEPTGPTVYFR